MPPDRAAHSRDGLRLLALLALAAVLRLWGLDQVPRGFYFDESAAVVEARCLRETGRDLHGERWPFFFRNLDDWKPPEYLYGVALTGPLLGDDVAGGRRHMALVGLATVLATWWLGREVLGRRSQGPLLAAGLLAVSPWHLQYSRFLLPAASLVLVQCLAMGALLRAVRLGRSPRATPWLGLGGLLWGFEAWPYAPGKLWVLLLGGALLVLAALDARRWPFSARGTVAAAVAFALTAGTFAVAYLGRRAQVDLRFEELSLLHRPDAAAQVVRSYLSHFSLEFLVGEGDVNLRHSPPGVGQLLLVELPLVAVGVVALARERAPASRLVLAWLALAPLLGSLAEGAPHATRTIVALPAIQLAAARGALAIARWFDAPTRRLVWPGLGALTALSALIAVRAVLVHAPVRTDPSWWHPGVERVTATAGTLADQGGLGPVVFLPGTHVTWVDWIYVRRLPPALLQAHAADTAPGQDRYDPFDQAGRFRFTGAVCVTPGCAPVSLGPGALVVQGPGDALPTGVAGWTSLGPTDDPAARYWRAR